MQKSIYWVRQVTYDQNLIKQNNLKTLATESEKSCHARKRSSWEEEVIQIIWLLQLSCVKKCRKERQPMKKKHSRKKSGRDSKHQNFTNKILTSLETTIFCLLTVNISLTTLHKKQPTNVGRIPLKRPASG